MSDCQVFDILYDNIVNNAEKRIFGGLISGVQENTWYCKHGLIVAVLNDNSLPNRTPFHNVDPRLLDLPFDTTTLPQPLGA